MRVAVTGASGFCGSYVARAAAARGDEVLCLSRREGPAVGRHVPWDAASEVPDLRGAELVIHCAAAVGDYRRGSADAARQVAVNVHGTERLLEAAATAGAAIVHVSSASVYDPRGSGLLAETDSTASGHLNAYGATKAIADRAAEAAGAVVLRPRAVYGLGDPHLVPRLLEHQRRGLMPLPGADVKLSLTAVETLAEACLAAATWPPGAYNIADAEPYQRDDAVRRVLIAHGRGAVRIVHVPPPVLTLVRALPQVALTRYAVDQLARTVVLDTGKARRQGFVPTRTLADYLSRVDRPAPTRVPATRRPPRVPG